jgi:hypothetical protein
MDMSRKSASGIGFDLLSFMKKLDQKMILIIVLVVFTLMLDTSISNIADLIHDRIVSASGLAIFISIAIVFGLGQYAILALVTYNIKKTRFASSPFRAVSGITIAIQSVLAAIMTFTIIQMIVDAKYSVILLTASTTLSYSLTTLMMSILALRLFSWYKSNKSLLVLLYGLAAAVSAFNGATGLAYFDALLLGKAGDVSSQSQVVFAHADPSSAVGIINSFYAYSAVASFILIWIGSVFLIRHHYYRKFGKGKFWIITSLPLVYFLSYFFYAFSDTIFSIY